MKATDHLRKEHEDIKAMLRILDEMSARLEAGECLNSAHLDDILEFIQEFADRCHHAKEENILFPAMETAGILRERGPIGVMLIEHLEGRKLVKGMREGLARLKGGEDGGAKAISENARKYSELLIQHIHKEDNILYPIADTTLSPEAEVELEKAFERVEIELIGLDRHERYRQILSRLAAEYPPTV